MESICIEVKPKCSKSFIIGAWYRPPKYELLLTGDMNCDDLSIDEKGTIIRKSRDLSGVFATGSVIMT